MQARITIALLACALLTCASVASWSTGVEEHKPSRILALFPHTGRSHQMVFEPLFRRLAERGHSVTVVSFFPVTDPPPPPTYRDVSLVGLREIYISKIDMKVFENSGSTFIEEFIDQTIGMNMLSEFAVSICEKFLEWPTVRELVRSNQTYDVILVENFNSDCMLGFARHYKAPFVALLSHNLMAWSSDRMGLEDNPAYVPVMGTSFTTEMTFFQRLGNTFFLQYFKNWYKFDILKKEQALLDKHFGKKTEDLDKLSRNYSLMLVNTHYTLNGVRPGVPGVVEVGGMHLERPKQTIPAVLEKFLNESTHGVIIFSFGTLVRMETMPKAKVDCFLKVFRKLPQRVVWKWEGDELKEDNIMSLKWTPQLELLRHPKVVGFIGHGGLLGLTEAADAGVPMLVIPFYGDQSLNGAAAERAGLARVLPYVSINEDTLYESISHILSPKMKQSAAQLSRVWHDRPAAPLDTAVYWVERTARLGHQQQMAAHSRNMPAYQLWLIDVAAAATTILILITFLLYFLIRTIINLIHSLTRSKLKTD